MIETIKLRYDKDQIVELLSNPHYILEAAVERELPSMDLTFLLQQIRGKGRSIAASKVLEKLKTHRPVKLVRFVGMKKWSATWWAAHLVLGSTTHKDTPNVLLLGWDNVHGAKAIVSYQGDQDDVQQSFEDRAKMKVDKEYQIEFELLDVTLGDPEDLPDLPGLKPVKEIKSAKRIAGFTELMAELPEPEPETAPEPEPTPTPDPVEEAKPALEASDKAIKAVLSAGKPTKKRKSKMTRDEKKEKLQESVRKRREKSEW